MDKKKVHIRYEVFPVEIVEKVYGMTTIVHHGKEYVIAVNSAMSKEIQVYSLGHELASIELGYTDKLEELGQDFKTFPQSNDLLDVALDYYEKYKHGLIDWDFTIEHNDAA